MEALKALKEKMKAEASLAKGSKKYVTKAELEAAKLLKIREEEEQEKVEKDRKRKLQEGEQTEQAAAKQAKANFEAEKEPKLPELSRDEVIRRLRALGQPKTLFGEEDYGRLKRLLKAETEMKLDDDALGGQQENLMLELQRADKEERARVKAVDRERDADKAADKAAADKAEKGIGAAREDGEEEACTAIVAEDPTMAAFKRAAAALSEKRMEDAMAVDDRLAHFLKKWSKEWGEDLERRPEEVKQSGSGYQAALTYRQTMKYLEPLYDRLKARVLHEELRTGLWMMVSAMKDRNYLYANDVYLRLAIGTAAWPIGVTSVGIHERSAREKISHSMNSSGSAHIMNDEATRKFLQAVKRLITFVQRAYPTDPSRSIDFQTASDMGRGMAGGGSDRVALLEAEATGEDWRSLGLSEAPHFMDEKDGSVKVPTKWQYILARAAENLEVEDEATKAAAKAAK